jgi:RNA polymerase sigma-70 factor, ECF subfamily
LKDETAAEDAVQEGYLRFFRHRASFRGESDIGTWLTRIVINQALMHRRRIRPTMSIEAGEPTAEILLHPALVTSEDPEKLAARRELRTLIEAAIAELPEAFRVVFVLREVEALSSEKVAQLLQIPAETVRTRLHRAKHKLRQSLDQEIASALTDSFPFAGPRCAALTDRVILYLRQEGLLA